MLLRTLAAAAALLVASQAHAADVAVSDAYARASNPKVAGAFMTLTNRSDAPARLVAVRSDAAASVELHTHIMEDGIARMRPVEAIEIPASGTHALQRGGDHVMLMGLTAPLAQDDTVAMTLVFEDGTELPLRLQVDNARHDAPAGHGSDHKR